MPAPSAADYLDFQQRGGVAELSSRAKLLIVGADRVRYLNGQVTANVTRMTMAEALPACVTTAKGKLCGDVFISSTPEALLIDAEPELRESLLARLERYIVSDDAGIEDVTETLGLLHFLPAKGKSIESLSGLAGIPQRKARRFGPLGVDVFVSTGSIPDHTFTWVHGPPGTPLPDSSTRPHLSPDFLEMLRIEHGIPRWGRELGEETLPPEAGLDRTHIDFQKGCYIGQEVISRLKSVGHVNRQLVGFTPADLAPGDPPGSLVAGMQIFAGADTRALGALTSATYSLALARPIALGYLKRGAPEGELFARSADGGGPATRVRVQPLPFLES